MKRVLSVLAVIVAICVQLAARAADASDDQAHALRERYASSQAESASPFGIALALSSSQ